MVISLLGGSADGCRPGTDTTNVTGPVRQVSHRITDPLAAAGRQGGMATPELISLIVALVVWIALLGSIAPEP
jgi:hypothetical protein